MGMAMFLMGCLFILLGLQAVAEHQIKKQADSFPCVLWCTRMFAGSLILRFDPWFSLYPQSLRILLMALSSLAFLFYVSFFVYLMIVWAFERRRKRRGKRQKDKIHQWTESGKGKMHPNIPLCFLIPLWSAIIFMGIGTMQAMSISVRQEHVAAAVTKPVQLLFISDLHMGSAYREPFADWERASQGCDGLLLGGDLYDEATSTKDMQDLCAFLNRMHQNMPIYYAKGNHESLQRKHAEYDEMLRKAGVRFLQDEVAELDGIRIMGRRDEKDEKRASFAQLTAHRKDKEPLLVLDHRPKLEDTHKIAVQLSGHTHDGQLFPNNLLVKIPYPDAVKRKNTPYVMLVSSGSGTWGFPMRIHSKSEMVLLTIVPEKGE